MREGSRFRRLDLINHLDERRVGTRLLFAGNLVRQPYMEGRAFRVSGELARTDFVMERTFWIGVYPGLSEAMLDHAATEIERFLGVT